MEILTAMTRSLLFISGLPAHKFWEHALEHATTLQNRTALMGRCTSYETRYGKRPHVNNLRVFGCEAMAYIEQDERHKLDYKVERCVYLGMPTTHTNDTAKLLLIKTMEIIFRRNVHYNERSYPARKLKHTPSKTIHDTGEDLIGLQFEDDDQWWTITEHGTHDGDLVLWYKNNETREEEKSPVQEVREWYNRTQLSQASTYLIQATNAIVPTRKGYINALAEEIYTTIKTYNVKLPDKHTHKPTSFKKASNLPVTQWFQAEEKEKDGMLKFKTWEYLNQKDITPEIRRKALRCHHIYDIKRDLSAKNRVVVNGSRQHQDTYTDTTSPVAGQLLLRLFLAIAAFRTYKIIQLDLTNAYLHAPIQDVVFIYIPECFPHAGEIARLRKAAYGTKQGARRFYDYTVKVLDHIGFTKCPNDPCLFRYLTKHGHACFLLQYVDDALIVGEQKAITQVQEELKKYFQCKFQTPKDFLGLDLTITKPGEITLSMETFTSKMRDVLEIHDTYHGEILTPGRTDKKINKTEDIQENEKYRSHGGSLNWLTMSLRYDLAFITKELSRVLNAPTKTANEIVNRALLYAVRTKNAHLRFSHAKMFGYLPPKTRKKPTDINTDYSTDFNMVDGITHNEDDLEPQTYTYTSEQLTLTAQTDIDLAGKPDTRQSTSAYMLYLNGTLFHWRAHTEKLIIKNTMAGEFISLSRGNEACKTHPTLLWQHD
jgi:hypothetical protein